MPLSEQQGDQGPGADHLGNHVERADGQGAERRHGAHGARAEAVGEHVGHGVLAGIAQRLGDDQEHGEVGDQPADRVHEAVVALEGDDAGDAEEAGGAHVVAGDGDAVLPAFDLAAGGEIGAGAGGAAGGPEGDHRG